MDRRDLRQGGLPVWMGSHDGPLARRPLEVGSLGGLSRDDVDLLARALPDVADRDVVAIEREAERVAQADRPDLVATFLAHEGILLRDPVARRGCASRRPSTCVLALFGLGLLRVDAKKLSEELVQAARVVELVVPTTAVARPDPKLAVRAERGGAAVVVAGVAVADGEHGAMGVEAGSAGVVIADLELGELDVAAAGVLVAVPVVVIDVEAARLGEVGRER